MKDDYIRKSDAVNALEEKEHEPWYLHKDLEWISGVVEAKDEIKAIEPVDAAPVVHGKWTKLFYDGFNCNKCGSTFVIMQGRNNMYYCPNCGAKMDGEECGHVV